MSSLCVQTLSTKDRKGPQTNMPNVGSIKTRSAKLLSRNICLLIIFADQVFIDPTIGIFVCGPLQPFVVNDGLYFMYFGAVDLL